MKSVVSIIIIVFVIMACSSGKTVHESHRIDRKKVSDTVKIANDSLEYEVVIIDPGFTSWLANRAFPRGYYSENYLEIRNRVYVIEWNRRAMQPFQFDPDLYQMQINYDANVHYGYEVNYLIYNYFIYFQNRYNQNLGGFVPNR